MATDNTFYADKTFISGIKPNGSFPLIEANSVCVDNNITKLLPNYLLPEATTANKGKLLGINDSGKWSIVDSGLPAVTSSANGKSLIVKNGSWQVDTLLPSVTNDAILIGSNGAWSTSGFKIKICNLATWEAEADKSNNHTLYFIIDSGANANEMQIVNLSQEDYDALASHPANTIYNIIEE